MAVRIPGPVRSAYIFGILPQGIRSHVLGKLHSGERDLLDRGIRSCAGMPVRQRTSILARFVREMRERRDRRIRIKDESLMAGFGILAVLLAAATAVSFVTQGSTDGRIRFIEDIIAGGGAHLALLPLVAGYLRAEFGTPAAKLLLGSGNHGADAAIGFILAMGIAASFIALTGTPSGRGDPIVGIFTLVASSTAGPALEEIVFRHLLFTVLGKKTGLAAAGAFSSLLFAAIHLPDNAPLFLAYVGAGAALCVIRHVRRSLFPTMTAHALANAVILIS